MLNQSDLPLQTQQVYKELLSKKKATAKEIAAPLFISSNTVYRAVKPLINFGMVRKIDDFPCLFEVNPPAQAFENYVSEVQQTFLQTFFPHGFSRFNDKKSLNISFVKHRSDFIEQCTRDIEKAEREVNLIVSGLELPSDTILSYKEAVDRGVKILILVQQGKEVNKEMYENWQKIGVEVRYSKVIEARIIIIDSKILYLTSFNPAEKEESMGVRFEYYPVAKIMDEVFKERWGKAKSLSM